MDRMEVSKADVGALVLFAALVIAYVVVKVADVGVEYIQTLIK